MSIIVESVVDFIPSMSQDMLMDKTFKMTLVASINSSLHTLVQNGVGKPINMLENPDATWNDFLGPKYNPCAQQYVFLKAYIEFDPPAQSTLNTIQGLIAENLFRARVESENDL